MEWIYIVCIDSTEYKGKAECSLQEERSDLLYSEYEAMLGNDVFVAICEEKDEELRVSKCWGEVRNRSSKPVRVSKISVGFRANRLHGTLRYFSSSWGKEFVPHDIPIPEQFRIGTLEGRSSQEYSPWLGIESDAAHYSLALAWSGNWSCEIWNRNGRFQVTMGIHEDDFFSDVGVGEVLAGAAVYFSGSQQNLEEASRRLRKHFLRHDSVLDPEKIETLPVTYNTWWCYEDRFVDEDICIKNAQYAAEAKMTHFVLDAGWFGVPDPEINWFGKLGDWDVENKVNFPSWLGSVGKAVADI